MRISAEAEADLADIHTFIASDNPDRADSFLDEIEAAIARAASDPLHHPVRTDLPGHPHAAGYGRYRIYFLISKADILVLRVLHSARDIAEGFPA